VADVESTADAVIQRITGTRAIIETVLTTLVGAAVSGSLVAWLLTAADSRWGRLVIGWLFVLPAGVIDTIPALFNIPVLTRAPVLIALAAVVGATTGYVGGRYQAYDWRNKGVLQFLADLTWGLAGSTIAAVMHGVNHALGHRPQDHRTGAHRYDAGFTTGKRFAFTQGAVMSNLRSKPNEPLHIHERVHVLQHRVFGPIFPITYLAWSIVIGAVAIVASVVLPGFKDRIEGWAYFSNPWEAWAYQVHGHAHHIAQGFRKEFNQRSWRNGTVIAVSMLFFPAMVILGSLVLVAAF
jgi:hypothetical protein